MRISRISKFGFLSGSSVKMASISLLICFLCLQLTACGSKKQVSGNRSTIPSTYKSAQNSRSSTPKSTPAAQRGPSSPPTRASSKSVTVSSVPPDNYHSSRSAAASNTYAAGRTSTAAAAPRTGHQESRFHEVQTRHGGVHIDMGNSEVNMPLPSGFSVIDSKDARRKQVADWFIPGQNVYAVYERSGAGRSSSGRQALFTEPLLIVSSRPEMTDTNMPVSIFEGIKQDLLRDNGTYEQSKWSEFMRYTASRYRDSERLQYRLGVTGMGKSYVSAGYIIKEEVPGPSSTPIQVSHKTLVPPSTPSESTALSSAEFNISMHNIVYVKGHCFNLYYNARLRNKADYDNALKENARIMREMESRL